MKILKNIFLLFLAVLILEETFGRYVLLTSVQTDGIHSRKWNPSLTFLDGFHFLEWIPSSLNK